MSSDSNGSYTIHIENEQPNNSRPLEQSTLRSWRMNLNNVLSFSSAPSTEALRSFISHSGNFRYSPLSSDNVHILLNQEQVQAEDSSSSGGGGNQRLSENGNQVAVNNQQSYEGLSTFSSMSGGASNIQSGDSSPLHSTNVNNSNQTAAAPPLQTDTDDENNIISNVVIKVLSHFVRYLPFICILFLKFIHDHLLGIFDLILLHGIMYQINKTLRAQIALFSQKLYVVLIRDFTLVAFVVAYRIVLSQSAPDPFGLLINPPSERVTIEVVSTTKDESLYISKTINNYLNEIISSKTEGSAATPLSAAILHSNNTVTIKKGISLGVLVFYIAVNDLVLKLLTILIKIIVTMLPTTIIRHKPRARMYVLIEFSSQFYRALVPLHQWLMFLFESYSGLEVISGVLFSSFYMGAKGFEFVERGKSLKKALINFLRNMDYERKPTTGELDAAGTLCPICHDSYKAPIILECGHIFCDDCVSTWFKREQTCPMCRARISEDRTWQDGSTSFFYQLC